ncbi:Uncharacterised protein [Stenotrophomonas maltophilia]|nr:Uncharacterised protein [Stenotrophomonas maltophilia]
MQRMRERHDAGRVKVLRRGGMKLSIPQHENPSGEALKQLNVVGGKHNGCTLACRTIDEVGNGNLVYRVQSRERLIKDQDARVVKHAGGELQLLQVALGEAGYSI